MNRITALAAAAAVTASSLALATPAQAAPAKAKSYTVTAKANLDTAIAKEDTVKVKGRVSPKAAGEKVVLQQRVGTKKKWTATGTAKIKKNGTYKLTDKPSVPGSREYRVLKPGSKGVKKGFSAPVEVEVYRWEKLAYREAVNKGFVATGATIGAEYYGQTLATTTPGSPASLEYTLGRKCISLRATYALTDQSVSGSSGAVVVAGDGKLLTQHSLAVGTIFADEVVDITDVFRLKIDATTTGATTGTPPTTTTEPAATLAVATPEVLCTR